MASKARPLLIVLAIFFLLIAGAAVFLWPFFEGQEPQITLTPSPAALGRENTLELKVADQGRGLKSIKVALIQQGREKVVLQKDFPGPYGNARERPSSAKNSLWSLSSWDWPRARPIWWWRPGTAP
jgi:hypothetical protein